MTFVTQDYLDTHTHTHTNPTRETYKEVIFKIPGALKTFSFRLTISTPYSVLNKP